MSPRLIIIRIKSEYKEESCMYIQYTVHWHIHNQDDVHFHEQVYNWPSNLNGKTWDDDNTNIMYTILCEKVEKSQLFGIL